MIRVLQNPKLSLWIVTTLYNKKETKNDSEIIRHSDGWWSKFSQIARNNCSEYSVDDAYRLWIKNNETNFQIEQSENIYGIDLVSTADELVKLPLQNSKGYVLLLLGGSKIAIGSLGIIQNYLDKMESIPDVIYGDFDQFFDDVRTSPSFVMCWNRFYFLSNFYTGPLLAVRNEVIRNVIGQVPSLNLLELMNCILIEAIKSNLTVLHIPAILSHIADKSLSFSRNSTIEELISHYLKERYGTGVVMRRAEVSRIEYFSSQAKPLVSVIIPTHKNADMLEKCLASISANSTHCNYEIIIIANNVSQQVTDVISMHRREISEVVDFSADFNFSVINNLAVKKSSGEVLCFLNDDTEVITEGWLDLLSTVSLLDDVGAVGAKLLYHDGTIQHCGVNLGIHGISGHKYRKQTENQQNKGELNYLHEVASITGACLCLSKAKFLSVGGFDERFSHTFNDLDLCVRLRENGLVNLVVPYVHLFHYEGKSRGSDFNRPNSKRYLSELKLIHEIWGDKLEIDPYMNENLSTYNEDMRIKM